MSFLTLVLNIYTVYNILLIREKLKQEHPKFEEMDWDENIGDTRVCSNIHPCTLSLS